MLQYLAKTVISLYDVPVPRVLLSAALEFSDAQGEGRDPRLGSIVTSAAGIGKHRYAKGFNIVELDPVDDLGENQWWKEFQVPEMDLSMATPPARQPNPKARPAKPPQASKSGSKKTAPKVIDVDAMEVGGVEPVKVTKGKSLKRERASTAAAEVQPIQGTPAIQFALLKVLTTFIFHLALKIGPPRKIKNLPPAAKGTSRALPPQASSSRVPSSQAPTSQPSPSRAHPSRSGPFMPVQRMPTMPHAAPLRADIVRRLQPKMVESDSDSEEDEGEEEDDSEDEDERSASDEDDARSSSPKPASKRRKTGKDSAASGSSRRAERIWPEEAQIKAVSSLRLNADFLYPQFKKQFISVSIIYIFHSFICSYFDVAYSLPAV